MRLNEIFEISDLDKQIHLYLQDWIISSFNNFQTRKNVINELLKLEIPSLYKFVPSDIVYRFFEDSYISNDEPKSWSYTFSGAKKLKNITNKQTKKEKLKIFL
jgi:hypothetical protein